MEITVYSLNQMTIIVIEIVKIETHKTADKPFTLTQATQFSTYELNYGVIGFEQYNSEITCPNKANRRHILPYREFINE